MFANRWVSKDGVLAGAFLEDPRSGKDGAAELLPCSGAFLAIGHKPMTKFLHPLGDQEGSVAVELDGDGYIINKKVPRSELGWLGDRPLLGLELG